MCSIPSFVIAKTSIPFPDAVSRSDDDFIASVASLIPSSIVISFLYVLSSSPKMYGIPDEKFASYSSTFIELPAGSTEYNSVVPSSFSPPTINPAINGIIVACLMFR